MTYNPDHAITLHDVGVAALYVGGGFIAIVAVLAIFLFVVELLNPFSSGH